MPDNNVRGPELTILHECCSGGKKGSYFDEDLGGLKERTEREGYDAGSR